MLFIAIANTVSSLVSGALAPVIRLWNTVSAFWNNDTNTWNS